MRPLRTLTIAALAIALPLAAQTPAPSAPAVDLSAAPVWTVDKSHSSTTFRVRHMMSYVSGAFRDFDAKIVMDAAKPESSSVEFTIQTASIDTGNSNRDDHLRTADFFDAAKHPAITFRSTAVKAKSKTDFDVTGDLTMRGVTRRVTLPVTFLGFAKDGRGREKAGFSIETTIDRKDFDVVWNRTLDEGGLLLGDDVKVLIDLQVRKQ